MTTYTQSFFVEGRYFGSYPRRSRTDLDGLNTWEPDSLLFFCDQCGEVFARCPATRPDGTQVRWRSIAATCSRCYSPLTFRNPGSIWLSWDREFQQILPAELIRRELLLLTKYLLEKTS